MDRREFAATVATVAMTGTIRAANAARDIDPRSAQPQDGVGAVLKKGSFQIGMIIFENMTNLDFVGPHDIFSRVPGAQVTVLAKTLDAVTTDSHLRVLPQAALKDAPPLDLIFIGGGGGTTPLMEDIEMVNFLTARAPRARYITSVCTGALVLGAAGLLRGYKAATHWAAMQVLPILGAEPVHQRVVVDRNRITGGGVTSGIDFALTVIGKIWGDEEAQTLQLINEYAPQAPYTAGSPETAPAVVTERVTAMLATSTNLRIEAAHRAMAKMTQRASV